MRVLLFLWCLRLFSFGWKRNRVWSEPRDLRAPAKVFARVRSYMITSPSFPSDLGSGTYTELPYHDGEDDELENEGG